MESPERKYMIGIEASNRQPQYAARTTLQRYPQDTLPVAGTSDIANANNNNNNSSSSSSSCATRRSSQNTPINACLFIKSPRPANPRSASYTHATASRSGSPNSRDSLLTRRKNMQAAKSNSVGSYFLADMNSDGFLSLGRGNNFQPECARKASSPLPSTVAGDDNSVRDFYREVTNTGALHEGSLTLSSSNNSMGYWAASSPAGSPSPTSPNTGAFGGSRRASTSSATSSASGKSRHHSRRFSTAVKFHTPIYVENKDGFHR